MTPRNTLFAGVIALALAASGAHAQTPDALPSYRPAVDAAIAFPAPETAARRQGVFVPPRHVVMVTPGMTKGQIYTLLDVPHFRTGLVGVRRWNYILNFYTGNGDEYVACQYQIRFDSRSRVEGTYWRDQSCADLVERLLASPSVAAPVAAPAATVVVSRSSVPTRTYDFTFAFDSSVVDAEGMRVLHEAAQEINTGQYAEVIVTGYTDTVGSVDYNDALAARRAAQGAGVLRSLVSVPVYSRSSRDLEVPTTTQVEDVRNRRVQIELYATAVERPHPTTVR